MSTLRLYSFIHCYVSSIQQGIQTGHAMGEVFNKYIFGPNGAELQRLIVKDWNQKDKTWITLNGGNSKGLKDILAFLDNNPIILQGTALPYADFREDDDSMEGMRTGIAIILPDEIYDAIPYSKVLSKVDEFGLDFKTFTQRYGRKDYEDAWFWFDSESKLARVYPGNSVIGQFLTIMKRCGLAR